MPPIAPDFDPRAIRLIVYDLDGTLLDAFEDIQTALNAALGAQGLAPLPLATVRGYVGDGVGMLVRRALGPDHMAHHDAVLAGVIAAFRARPVVSARLYPGVAEALEKLRARGLKQAVLSNKLEPAAAAACATFGLTSLVDGVWGEREGVPRKPDPAALRQVLEHFNIPAQACLMAGDGPADHAVARAAGARFAGVTWGVLGADAIAALAPDAVADSMDALAALFD